MKKKNELRKKQMGKKDEPGSGKSLKASDKSVFMMKSKGQSFEDFKRGVIEALRGKGMLAESPKITGGDGSSVDRALVVNAKSTHDGVSAENAYIESKCGKWNVDFTIDRQMQIDHDGRKYDLIYVNVKKDGSKREFWFDVTSFFGKL